MTRIYFLFNDLQWVMPTEKGFKVRDIRQFFHSIDYCICKYTYLSVFAVKIRKILHSDSDERMA
jgi:hypothetical protein